VFMRTDIDPGEAGAHILGQALGERHGTTPQCCNCWEKPRERVSA
jgi:hypothetical protein